ncbi:MAG: integration host factor subunit beta [Massilibacteroides sp.]|nr:integration host factor subunit beta [Massilibacteroides sp.]
MTKADIVKEISDQTGIDRRTVLATVETFMATIIDTVKEGENVYLRGFGSFVIKARAAKTARNISKNTTIVIPAHNVPIFRPSKGFLDDVMNSSEKK